MNPTYYLRKHAYSAVNDGPKKAFVNAAHEALDKIVEPKEKKIGSYNGVAVRNVPQPHEKDVFPDSKQYLVDSTLACSKPGDTVVFVGGGRGIAPVRAAREGRDVIVYEAAVEMVDRCNETARLNKVDMEIVHALIEADHNIFGSLGDAETLSTTDLSGDVLVLDCEGAEADILPASQFDAVVVETHPMFGADTRAVRDLLDGESQIIGPDPQDGDIVVRQ